MEKTDKKNIIDWLFSTDNETVETKEIKMTRLSKIRGEDVIFTIKSLGFDDICHYRAIQDDSRRQIWVIRSNRRKRRILSLSFWVSRRDDAQ